MATTVVNKSLGAEYDVDIGRPGYFGNPYTVANYGRERCIELYRKHFYARLQREPEFKKMIDGLRGKVLGCYCKPLACHGDIIAEYLNGEQHAEGTV